MNFFKKGRTIAAITSILGISAAAVTSVIVAYDAIFPRHERPNYDFYPGQYCIERIPELKRKEFWIWSGDNKLKSYFYKAQNSKGVVIFSHGIRAGADEYLPIFKYLTDNGYSVLAYNNTGTYESEGDSTVGMCQALIDMYNVVGYVQSKEEFKGVPLFTMGHSLGGYAATSVLSLKKGINATAVIAPLRNGSTVMVEKAEQYVGKLASATNPILDSYQKTLFGKFVDYDAIKGINRSGIPILVAQGVDDKTVTFDGQSITAKINDIKNPNVKYYLGKGLQGGHDTIWHSQRAVTYQTQVKNKLKLLEKQKEDELSEQELKAFYKTVDHELYSEVNYDLLRRVVALFDSTLQ